MSKTDYGYKTTCTCGGLLETIGTIGIREFYRCEGCGNYSASYEWIEYLINMGWGKYDVGHEYAEAKCPDCGMENQCHYALEYDVPYSAPVWRSAYVYENKK